tara:strand:- start:1025 stop:1852 length:828 start_codon:yes stop_codon:yes gene_type:complete
LNYQDLIVTNFKIMKITLFTSNGRRHNYLINLLSIVCDELWVIQECKPFWLKNDLKTNFKNKIIGKYFDKVLNAEEEIFENDYVNKNFKNIKIFPILYGELNRFSLTYLKNFLKSDLYLVFGSSFIKGKLVDYLVKKKTVNIHAGVSPYYRGTDCNFWALYDNNPHLVGSTIHLLSKGIDNGPILYHAMSNIKPNPFYYTMSTIKSAFHSIVDRIENKKINNLIPIDQDISKEIRYSKKIEFNENIANKYLKKKINLKSKRFENCLLKDPFFLNE